MTEQLGLAYPIVAQLDISKGVYDVENLQELEIDPDQRQNLPMLAGRIGVAMGVEPRTTVTDNTLRVGFRDFRNAKPSYLQTGLIIEPGDIRFEKAQQLVVARRQETELNLQGIVPATTGVVFPADEFKIVARNARDFAKHIQATTRRANEGSSQIDHDELEKKVQRSAAHALRGKKEGMEKLDSELIEQRQLMGKMYRDSNHIWRTAYLAKNLNQDRKRADELIHRTAETATINLNLGTREVSNMHRALASELYRRGSSKELAQSWQRSVTWVALHLNAKRGKLDQSIKDCNAEFADFAGYIPTNTNKA